MNQLSQEEHAVCVRINYILQMMTDVIECRVSSLKFRVVLDHRQSYIVLVSKRISWVI